MNPFHYGEHALYCEGVALAEIAARVGTPCYVYSAATILANFRAYDQTFGDHAAHHLLCDEGEWKPGGAALAGARPGRDSTSFPAASCFAC